MIRVVIRFYQFPILTQLYSLASFRSHHAAGDSLWSINPMPLGTGSKIKGHVDEEKRIFRGYAVPLRRLDPFQIILSLAPIRNTYDKHQLDNHHPKLRKASVNE